ncbi:unnamed protein product, partial [Staurois parvus]
IHSVLSPTVHTTWKCNYFSKYKLLNTFFLLSVFSGALVKACRGVYFLLKKDAEPLTSFRIVLIGLVLITCTLPKKKNPLAIHTKLSMCRVST